jgi:hypothetical protein
VTAPVLFRVENGDLDAHELAALAAVLHARAARPRRAAEPARATALWRRPERAAMFSGPRGWAAATS